MKREQQIELLESFVYAVKVNLLNKANNWPSSWDGFEIRWLVEEAFKFEAPDHKEYRKRHSDFLNDYNIRNLY